MRVTAKARNLSISAQKLRLVANMVRGKKANVALGELRFMPQKGALMVYDAITSALANGTHNYNLNSANLFVAEIKVDQGSKLKRFKPRSRGMANAIEHPSAHLTVVLDEAPKENVKEVKNTPKKIKETK
jgi:large subunit ribosomal protein L22